MKNLTDALNALRISDPSNKWTPEQQNIFIIGYCAGAKIEKPSGDASPNSLCEFIEEMCEVSETIRVKQSELYAGYTKWCSSKKLRPVGKHSIKHEILKHMGSVRFEKSIRFRDGTVCRGFYGIALR